MGWISKREKGKMDAAYRTLRRIGYTYHGGEEWEPPLGAMPNFGLIDNARRLLNLHAKGVEILVLDFEAGMRGLSKSVESGMIAAILNAKEEGA